MANKGFRLKRGLALAALLLTGMAAITPVLSAQTGWFQVRIENGSRYQVSRMYLSPASNNYWGPDLLGSHVLPNGYVFTTREMPTGQYDLKLVDEDGDVCVVSGLSIGEDTSWRITDRWLLNCEFH
jgi:hypothetical protein